jgi:hypothetical protein
MTTSRTISMTLLALVLGCASSRSALRSDKPRDRVTDSPAEKMAAMPVPDPSANPENKDQRFGIESARERGETAKQKREDQHRCVDVVSAGEASKGKPPCTPANK